MSTLKVNAIRNVTATSDAVTLATDGTCTANITNNLSNRRININGAMNVAQRGTVTGITSSTYAGPDRFRFGISGHGTYTVSQDTSAPTGSGFANSLKLACTTADTSVASGAIGYFQHKLEGQDCQQIRKGTSNAKQLAVQFWVKSNKTGTYAFWVYDNDNARSFTTTYAISSADTWEKKTIIVPADTTGVLGNDTNVSLTFNFLLVAGSSYTSGSASSSWGAEVDANSAFGHNVNIADSTSNTWYMTGFQIELGNVHTDFEHRLFGQELALCQRYFIKISDGKYRRVGGYKRNDTNVYFEMQTPVPMRTAPSPTLSDGGLFTNFAQTYTASQNNPSIQEWNTDTGQGLLGIQSSYSNQSEFIPSWESYELELSAEL
tara:strand:+ start:1672 stop:2802 length:1131 start_codon:yes stop_codon:yes gene_type:complete